MKVKLYGTRGSLPIANAAAVTQTRDRRRYPRVLQAVGALGCLVLVATLPPASIAVGAGVLAVGVVYRLLRMRGARDCRRARA